MASGWDGMRVFIGCTWRSLPSLALVRRPTARHLPDAKTSSFCAWIAATFGNARTGPASTATVQSWTTGGLLRPRVERLIVGRRDCTNLVDGVLKQVQIVRAVVGDQIPVHGVLCFVDADWPVPSDEQPDDQEGQARFTVIVLEQLLA